jgi:phosphate transport system substrate-binding protein
MNRTSVIRVVVLLVIGTALGFGIYYSPALLAKKDPPPPVRLKTGGTSIAHVIVVNRWRTAYRKETALQNETGVEVDHESTGSTEGIDHLIDKKYAIAFTHAPLSDEQKKKADDAGGEVVHVPVVLCAVVPVYNLELKDSKHLNFTADVLADIFLGKIEYWDHPDLVEVNKGANLPHTKITVVHREDSSGTTLIFTDYLHDASKHWRDKHDKASSTVDWKGVGVGMRRNEGVARHVLQTEGAIGYVDLLHAIANGLPRGAVQNADSQSAPKEQRKFVAANSKTMTAAAEGLLATDKINHRDLTFSLTNQPGPQAYPICGAIWAVCYKDQPPVEQKRVVDFLRWVTHDGQRFAKSTSYAPLPDELVALAEAKINSISPVP